MATLRVSLVGLTLGRLFATILVDAGTTAQALTLLLAVLLLVVTATLG